MLAIYIVLSVVLLASFVPKLLGTPLCFVICLLGLAFRYKSMFTRHDKTSHRSHLFHLASLGYLSAVVSSCQAPDCSSICIEGLFAFFAFGRLARPAVLLDTTGGSDYRSGLTSQCRRRTQETKKNTHLIECEAFSCIKSPYILPRFSVLPDTACLLARFFIFCMQPHYPFHLDPRSISPRSPSKTGRHCRIAVLVPTRRLAIWVYDDGITAISPAVGNRPMKTQKAHERGAFSPPLPLQWRRHRHTRAHTA